MNKLLLPTAVLWLSILASAVTAQSTQKLEPWADAALPVEAILAGAPEETDAKKKLNIVDMEHESRG